MAYEAEKNPKTTKNFKKLEKSKFYQEIAKICDIKKLKTVPRLIKARWGWGNSGGSTVGVSSTSKNRPSHHK